MTDACNKKKIYIMVEVTAKKCLMFGTKYVG